MKIIIFFFKFFIFLLKITKNNLKESNETIINSNIAVIPFKTFYLSNKNNSNSFTSKEYIDDIIQSYIYLEIEIGKNIKKREISKEDESKIENNKQFISLFIELDDFIFYIDDNYFYDNKKKKICRYSSQLSTSYEQNPSKNNLQYDAKNSIQGSDYFKIFSDLSLIKYNIIKINFQHYFDKKNNISFACGKTGLLVPSNKLYINTGINFIYQIQKNLENVDNSFMIKYNYNKNIEEMNDGVLIIGAESYEKNSKEELISIYTKPNQYGSMIEWRFDVDQIIIGNHFFEFKNEEFVIKSDIEGIEIPYSFYSQLNKIYFNNYYRRNICKYDIVNNIYLIISCNANIFHQKDIKIFPRINFLKFKIKYNFTFSGEELFYKSNNNYFFKMIANFERYKADFKLGRIFLKKYKIIFNSDSKIMYFYKNNNERTNDLAALKGKKQNIFLFSFSYIFIGILFLLIGIYFGRKYCFMKRKIHANELEDNNYIYQSKSKGIKKNQKLIEL